MKAIELLEYAKKYDAHITNKMIDEAIEELKQLQSRTCESCKYQADSNEGAWCIVLDIEILSPSFCCNRYKEKENQ